MNDNQSSCKDADEPGIAVEDSVPGLNDNVDFLGRQLHVQTERIGFPAPQIVTQVFNNGRIVFSKKCPLTGAGSDPGSQGILDLMRAQHSQTIREIEAKQRKALDSRPSSIPGERKDK